LISNLASPLSPPTSPPAEGPGDYYIASRVFDQPNNEWTWEFNSVESGSPPLSPVSAVSLPRSPEDLNPERDGDTLRVITLSLAVTGADGNTQVWDELPLDPKHEGPAPEFTLRQVLSGSRSLSQALRLPIVITLGKNANGENCDHRTGFKSWRR